MERITKAMPIIPKKYKTKILYAVGLVLVTPSIAFAHGDPIILYSGILIALLHFSCGIYLLLSKKFLGFRIPVLAVYMANVVISWVWAVGYKGPNFTGLYIGLTGGPLLTFLCLIWLLEKMRGSKPGRVKTPEKL